MRREDGEEGGEGRVEEGRGRTGERSSDILIQSLGLSRFLPVILM